MQSHFKDIVTSRKRFESRLGLPLNSQEINAKYGGARPGRRQRHFVLRFMQQGSSRRQQLKERLYQGLASLLSIVILKQ